MNLRQILNIEHVQIQLAENSILFQGAVQTRNFVIMNARPYRQSEESEAERKPLAIKRHSNSLLRGAFL